MKTEFANKSDVKPILAILQEHLLDLQNPNRLAQDSGFLVRHFSEKEIEDLILDNKNNLVLTARDDDKVIGYITSSRFSQLSENIQKDVIDCLQVTKISDLSKVLYYRQIAVKYGATKSGIKNIGSNLIERFLKEAKIAGYDYIICRIIHEPVMNSRSISFHQKFGFDEIGTAKEKDFVAGIYLKDLN